MKQYLDLLRHILENGIDKTDRTGTGTLSVFGHQMRFNLQDGFPLITTKRVHLKSIIHELLWILRGDTTTEYLKEHGVTIWDEWATAEQCAKFGRQAGDLGPVYGKQWRNFNGHVDQIANLIHTITINPDSRRLIVTGWNPSEINQVALPPCHTLFQFYVHNGNLSCQLYQRSGDIFLGVPFNIASYSLLTMMVAQVCNLKPYEFIHTIGDAHLYKNHLSAARLQITREPRPLPIMIINPQVKDIFAFTYEDFKLIGYDPHPRIPAQVSV